MCQAPLYALLRELEGECDTRGKQGIRTAADTVRVTRELREKQRVLAMKQATSDAVCQLSALSEAYRKDQPDSV